ncbi:hypothetical protein BDV95DRAFT_595514 [Massariosphaeria phaeospora]|uniref:Uncharacterized protein n=1 Tax=Massariosphaeria phaeospora TaxID=100035 RepID=A0A7C8M982_9PLEO|nr:hypothetical protein BDV95DRAFT_595514 [Massariosphaeria phaeospora]
MMNDKLPRELRDLIYMHLCVQDKPIAIGTSHFKSYFFQFPPLEHDEKSDRKDRRCDIIQALNESYYQDLATPDDGEIFHGQDDHEHYARDRQAYMDYLEDQNSGSELDDERTFEQEEEIEGYGNENLASEHETEEEMESTGDGDEDSSEEDYHDSDALTDDFDDPSLNERLWDQLSRNADPSCHFLNPAYMGDDIALEASETYYTHNKFSVCNWDEKQDMESFFLDDTGYNFSECKSENGRLQHPTGMIPGDFVRKLEIYIKCEHYDSSTGRDTGFFCNEKEKGFIWRLYDSLRAVRFLWSRHQYQMEVEFVIMTSLQDPKYHPESNQRVFINILDMVREPVYSFIHLGHTVRVFHRNVTEDHSFRDITGIFTMSAAQWEQEEEIRKSNWWSFLCHYINSTMVGYVKVGYTEDEAPAILNERWGLKTVWDTKCTFKIRRGKFWPRGYQELEPADIVWDDDFEKYD